MRKILLFFLISCVCLMLSGCLPKTKAMKQVIMEEVVPIRNNDVIIGMNYYITLPVDFNINNNLKTHIIDSISHYKDIHNVDTFYVSIIIKNQTKKDYYLNHVYIRKNGVIVNQYSYDLKIYHNQTNSFSLTLNDELSEDCAIELSFKR